MQSFDAQLWKDRAWERYARAVHRGAKKRSQEPRWARDVIAIGCIGKVVEWCSSKKITVLFARKYGANYDPAEKKIVVSHRAGPDRQLAYLLHECGHHLIGTKVQHDRFAAGYPMVDDPSVSRTLLHRVAVLEEELEAWHRGWKLAERLELPLSKSTYDTVRLECVKSYVGWTLRGGKL